MNDKDRAVLLGSSLAAVLPTMLQSVGVARVTVDQITKSPSFRGGAVSEQAQAITGPARDEHRERGFGFWEFALERTLNTDPQTRRALLYGALSHSPVDIDQRSTLTVDEFADNLASGAWDNLPPRSMVNLCSTVYTADGQVGQLVLLDFGVPAVRASSIEAAVDVLDVLDLSGALFSSGRSFHFVSAQVVTHDQMRVVLARAQLLSPLIDARWVSHQLIDGECRLRVSTDVGRNAAPHRFIGSV